MAPNEQQPSPEFLALQAQVAGRYSLDRELGRGGMGIVYLAREVALDRLVAIKLLPPALAADQRLRDRFLREARTAAQLSHPHIVSIYAVEAHDALVFFVMEYVAGETLGERIRRRGALPIAEALRVMQEVSWAIAHAHARGVVHRDIKPDNILLEAGSDRALVTDFGIAAFGDTNTPVGAAMGTVHFMSPEQALGAAPDVRGDVYALGVTAFAALAGRKPFEGASGMAVIAQQAGNAAPAIRTFAPTLSSAAAAVVDRALAREPEARWGSVEEFAAALQGARALVPPLPIPLRKFVRDALENANQLSAVVGGTVSAAASAAIVDIFVVNSFLGLDTFLFKVVALLGAGFTLLLLGLQVQSIRTIAKAAYTRDAALRAVRQLDEEDEAVAPALSGRLGGLWDRYQAVNGIGFGLTALGIIGTVQINNFLTFPCILMALIMPVVTVRRLIELHGAKGSWWGRLFKTKVGKRVWSLATFGLKKVRSAPSSGEPTAMVLGGAIHELYDALPTSERQLLGEVPALIDRLSARALDHADAQRVDAIMALETLRLDLLKLRAGQIAADGMTTDFERLREVGYRVDAVGELRDDRLLTPV
jgi:serine/threonine-protein kinase